MKFSPGRPKKMKSSRVFIFYVPDDIFQKVREIAYTRQISMGEYVRQALQEKLMQEKKCTAGENPCCG